MFFLELISVLAYVPFMVLHAINQNSFPKPLSKKEEEECLRRIKLGDKNARDKLIRHNLRLVAHIVKKYYLNNSDPDDLISIGTIGLIKAVNTFNMDKGVRISSYASRCIENEILMYFRSTKKASMDVSINEPIETDKNGNVLTIIDTIATDDSVVDVIHTKNNIEKLKNNIVNKLSPRERKIICFRYGLEDKKPLPQREVAKRLGISRSYVSRIEKKAISILKKSMYDC